MSVGKLLFNNIWAKLITLALACATWFYVFDLINADSYIKKKDTLEDFFDKYDYTVKVVPVKPMFYGRSPEGYRVDFNKVIVEPDRISIMGPETVLKDVDELRTDEIDIGEYTRSARVQAGIRSDNKYLDLEDDAVTIYLPVEPLQK